MPSKRDPAPVLGSPSATEDSSRQSRDSGGTKQRHLELFVTPSAIAFIELRGMADTKDQTKKVKGQRHIAPTQVRSANLVIVKIGSILTAVFVALSIGMTFYYRTIVSWLFF